MPYTRETILATTPLVFPARSGFLAVSEPMSHLRVGVLGADENDARARFAVELEAWARLHDRRERGYVS